MGIESVGIRVSLDVDSMHSFPMMIIFEELVETANLLHVLHFD